MGFVGRIRCEWVTVRKATLLVMPIALFSLINHSRNPTNDLSAREKCLCSAALPVRRALYRYIDTEHLNGRELCAYMCTYTHPLPVPVRHALRIYLASHRGGAHLTGDG